VEERAMPANRLVAGMARSYKFQLHFSN